MKRFDQLTYAHVTELEAHVASAIDAWFKDHGIKNAPRGTVLAATVGKAVYRARAQAARRMQLVSFRGPDDAA